MTETALATSTEPSFHLFPLDRLLLDLRHGRFCPETRNESTSNGTFPTETHPQTIFSAKMSQKGLSWSKSRGVTLNNE